MVYSCNKILFSNKNEQTIITYNNMYGSLKIMFNKRNHKQKGIYSVIPFTLFSKIGKYDLC